MPRILMGSSSGLGASQPVELDQAFLDALADLSVDAGAAAGTGVTAAQGAVVTRKTRITLDGAEVTMTDATTNGNHGGLKIYDFPTGLIRIVGAIAAVSVEGLDTGVDADAAVVASLGTVVVANTNETLTSTEADIIASTAATFTDAAGTFNGVSAADVTFDGTGTPKGLYINFAVPGADADGGDTFTLDGYVDIFWEFLGDHP